ncbi:MAG: GNAT family protein [Candidatus Thermoplasmatota archaeon]|jgi:RimJ/RimL family protein N-acetyltransferase
MAIKGATVTLRAPEPKDIPQLNAWANDADLWQWLIGWHFPYSSQSTEEWVAKQGDDPSTCVLCIDAPGMGLVGTIGLRNLNWKDGNASVGVMVGDPRARGKGIGADALQAISNHAFDELGLHRLDAEILAGNKASLALFKQCGWTVEGVRREWVRRSGSWHDKVLVGLTVDEYRAFSAAPRRRRKP